MIAPPTLVCSTGDDLKQAVTPAQAGVQFLILVLVDIETELDPSLRRDDSFFSWSLAAM
jgi:hypothetical protein